MMIGLAKEKTNFLSLKWLNMWNALRLKSDKNCILNDKNLIANFISS